MENISDLKLLIKDPFTKENLELHLFENQKDGILINSSNNSIFPISQRVAVLLKNHIQPWFYEKYQSELLNIVADKSIVENQIIRQNIQFSFSMEWEAFETHNMDQTWGISTQDRLQQFYLETNQTAESIIGKTILDAGCGNGLLTAALARQGANVIGLDFSDSVFAASEHTNLPNLLFIKADLMQMPFANQSFDIIISNGVIHHTPNTKFTFEQVAKTVKENGIFYLWLYKRPFGLYFSFFIRLTDFLRFIINKLPLKLQNLAVRLLTNLVYKIKIYRKRKMDYNQLLIDMYDTLTPAYKHYHHPLEVAQWFFENGFSAPCLTHWDNPYGFGIMAKKQEISQTPGINFDVLDIKKRFATV